MTSFTQPTLARAETLRSFARLLLFEPGGETLEALRKDAAFARTLPADPRELRVEFTRLFTWNVFPYASVFLDAEALLNTETSARVQAAYQAAGFDLDCAWAIGAPDHLGVELFFFAHLLETAHNDVANEFLRDEILSWAGVFLHAVEKNAQERFYRVLAQETRACLFSDFASQNKNADPHLRFVPADWTDADDLETVVAQLVIPSRSGIFLSRDDISTIARKLDLPISFGDRALMLKSLFRSAGEFEQIDLLLRALQAEINVRLEDFAADARAYPTCAPSMLDWLNRAGATLAKLQTMEQAVTTDGN